MVAEGLAGPLAGDEHAPAGVAEVFGPVRPVDVALGGQGNPDALARFVQLGRTDDFWETADLNEMGVLGPARLAV